MMMVPLMGRIVQNVQHDTALRSVYMSLYVYILYESPSLSPQKFDIVSMVDRQIGSGTHSTCRSIRHPLAQC